MRTAMYYVVPKSVFDEHELYKYKHSAKIAADGKAVDASFNDPVYVLKVIEVVNRPEVASVEV